ncbi:MAG TPA: fatty acid oxidation complex subunit alpha FadJ [Gemmatimonadaceae bacterium]|nr:fatty acid oxidation complex subunit alpha FadJ [Gemmatimonadaceae bacterium]
MTTMIGEPRAAAAFSVEVTRDGVAVVTFDLPNEPVNKFSRAVGEELAATLERQEQDRAVKAVVVMSGKPDVFIAGADIEEFLALRTAQDAERLSRYGQETLDRVERSAKPVVFAIHGACLGGGLEAALAAHYRIASDHPKTVLALPEVMLGLIPGMGGTQRLPRTVGLRNALDMILTGRNVRARKALKIGLIDELVHPAILREVAVDRARSLAEGRIERSKGRKSHGAADAVLEDNPVGRAVVLRQAREQTLKKTHGHYPAPLAAIDAVAEGYRRGMPEGLTAEAKAFGELAMTDVSRQLIFLFFATTSLKKDPGVEEPAPPPRTIDKLGILGAGFMGAGIASVAVQQGTLVRLKDAQYDRVGKGIKAVHDVVRERLKKKQITRQQFADYMALLGGTIDYSGFGSADLVIEAVFEDLALKHRVLEEAEAVIADDAIYASNTSSIPIGRIADASKRPERVLGMHFFSPVHKMPLLEVIVTPRTSKEATVSAVAYGKRLGKHVIVVNDGPGFYTTRILTAYMNEAGKLLDEGAAIEAIDKALVEFGFPVGPITLLDEVGIDVGSKIGPILAEAFGPRMAPADSFRRIVEAGRTGRKGKSGFYRYDEDGKKGGVDESVYQLLPTGPQRKQVPAETIVRRAVLSMVNEAARCLEEGILRSPRDGDIGAVFGIGFPPFRGGPFRYVDSVGAAEMVRQLEELDREYAPRYEPARLLRDMAREEKRFYPAEGRPV